MNFAELFALKEKDIALNKMSVNKITQCCIYFLFKGNKIVYVGQSKYGLSRVYVHLKTGKVFDGFYFISMNEDELNFWENFYIVKFHPIYNKALNPDIAYITVKECRKRLNKEGLRVFNKDIEKALKELDIQIVNCVDNKERFFEYHFTEILNHILDKREKRGTNVNFKK